jgi:hypothetical protein
MILRLLCIWLVFYSLFSEKEFICSISHLNTSPSRKKTLLLLGRRLFGSHSWSSSCGDGKRCLALLVVEPPSVSSLAYNPVTVHTYTTRMKNFMMGSNIRRPHFVIREQHFNFSQEFYFLRKEIWLTNITTPSRPPAEATQFWNIT